MNHSKIITTIVLCLICLCSDVCNAQNFVIQSANNDSEIEIISIKHSAKRGQEVAENFNIVFIVSNGDETRHFVNTTLNIPARTTITKPIPNSRASFGANSNLEYDFRVSMASSGTSGVVGMASEPPPSVNRQGTLNHNPVFRRRIVLKDGDRKSSITIEGIVK